MRILHPLRILALLCCTLPAAGAFATDPPARVGAERGEVRAEPKPDTPSKPAKKPLKRRAVAAQLDDGMTPVYAPRLNPPVVRSPPVSLAPQESSIPPGPVIMNGCGGAAHCMDQSGARYNAVGTTLISPQGRMCVDNGISVACY